MASKKRSRGKSRRNKKRGRPWTFSPLYILILASLLILAGGIWLMGARGVPGNVAEELGFPQFVRTATSRTQQAYVQAVTYRSEMKHLACYCGCGPGNGHRHLGDCFISEVGSDGRILYGRHAVT